MSEMSILHYLLFFFMGGTRNKIVTIKQPQKLPVTVIFFCEYLILQITDFCVISRVFIFTSFIVWFLVIRKICFYSIWYKIEVNYTKHTILQKCQINSPLIFLKIKLLNANTGKVWKVCPCAWKQFWKQAYILFITS